MVLVKRRGKKAAESMIIGHACALNVLYLLAWDKMLGKEEIFKSEDDQLNGTSMPVGIPRN